MKIKKCIIRILLCVEMCSFVYLYMFGKNGLQELQKQAGLLLKTEQEITQLQKEMVLLERDIALWQTDDFYKEKVAREQLQMARKGDILFYIGE